MSAPTVTSAMKATIPATTGATTGAAGTRALAAAATALMLVVVVASAWLRLIQPGPGCPGAAACTEATAGAASASAIATARIVHRLAASGVGLALLALVAALAAHRPRNRAMLGYAITALVLVTMLALVGARSAESGSGVPAPAAAFVNITGGLALLAVLWRLSLGTGSFAGAAPARGIFAARVALVATAAWIAGDAAIASGWARAPFAARLDLQDWIAPALGALGIAGAFAATSLACAKGATRRFGASIAVLVAAAVATELLATRASPIVSGLARTVVAALLLGALVAAASAQRARTPASPALR